MKEEKTRKKNSIEERQIKAVAVILKASERLYRKVLRLALYMEKTGTDLTKKNSVVQVAAALINLRNKMSK